jgi:hypothetical protein
MKSKLILKGKQYTDGKGSIREVLDVGPQYVLYQGQAETDNLQYKLLVKKRGPLTVGHCYNSTRSSFAAWAKSEIVKE